MPTGRHSTNRLLASLSKEDFAAIEGGFEMIELPMKTVIHEPREKNEYVYFLDSGVVSLLTVLENGTSIELATVGNEGMVEIASILGLAVSESLAIVQVPGTAWRMGVATFRDHMEQLPRLRTLMGAYTMELFTMVAQGTACNQAHTARQRCARWLLMTHDRVLADTFPITQEFLSSMLGVRRATVSIAAESLGRDGLVEYRRGEMRIKDRAGLEAASCECYSLIRDRFDRLPGREMGSGRSLSSGLWAPPANTN
jgi:CRP-like cAMP-binding protein